MVEPNGLQAELRPTADGERGNPRVDPQQFKGSNGVVLLLRYLVLSPVGHVRCHERLEELAMVRHS